MKLLTNYFAAVVFAAFLVSCQSNAPQLGEEKISGKAALAVSDRGSAVISYNNVSEMKYFGADAIKGIDLGNIEKIQLKALSAREQDRDEVMSLMRNFMGAESTAAQLEVEFKMSDAPIENGLFLFSIETPTAQSLMFQMYDEEGFELAANNKLKLKQGLNYKALNVKSLENGEYMFLLKDGEGKELIRKVSIQQ